MKKLWYKFCFSYLRNPMLMSLVIGFVVSQIVMMFTPASLSVFFLAVAIIIVTNYTVRKLIEQTMIELVADNPGMPLQDVIKKALGEE